MQSRLLSNPGSLRDAGALMQPSPFGPRPDRPVLPELRPIGPDTLASRLAAHRRKFDDPPPHTERRWNRLWLLWAVQHRRDAGHFAQAGNAELIEGVFVELSKRLKTASDRIDQLERSRAAHSTALVAMLLERVLGERFAELEQRSARSLHVLAEDLEQLRRDTEERLAWLRVEIDGLEVQIRANAAKPPAPTLADPAD